VITVLIGEAFWDPLAKQALTVAPDNLVEVIGYRFAA